LTFVGRGILTISLSTNQPSTQQEQIFTNWINFILRQRGLQISSVLSDLDDGLILIQLAEILIGKTVAAYERNPKLMVRTTLRSPFPPMKPIDLTRR
jgi:hypothetical protein